jgi:hypothetical protein
VTVSGFTRSIAFYAQALKPLGSKIFWTIKARMVTQTLKASEMTDASSSGSKRGGPIRMPFTSVLSPKAMRNAFFVAAIAGGGREKTPPAPQLQYHPDYYAT